MKIEELPIAFETYYKTFPSLDMHILKFEHTKRVVQNAERIMRDEGFSERLYGLGSVAAWLHDVGRFKQFERFGTFSDRVSINHALLSCSEILRLGWLEDWSPEDRHLVLRAIEFHSLRELPPYLTEEELLLCHLVRDADKLDIYTVLDDAIATHYLESHPEVYWGLPLRGVVSKRIVEAITRGESIDYAQIKSFADFVLIQVSWCCGGLFFKASRQMVQERNEVDIRERYLCELIPSEALTIQKCCQIAREALNIDKK